MGAALQTLALGLLESAGVVGAVLAFGLTWAGLGGAGSRAGEAPYTGGVVDDTRPDTIEHEGVRWLVDGFNVLHAGVLRGRDRRGWWREEARARLLERVAAFEEPEAELWVVFDGEGPGADAERASQRPRVVFAPSADDWLVGAVKDASDPSQLVVVTADRQLADRVRHKGARVISPRTFLARCESQPEGPLPPAS